MINVGTGCHWQNQSQFPFENHNLPLFHPKFIFWMVLVESSSQFIQFTVLHIYIYIYTHMQRFPLVVLLASLFLIDISQTSSQNPQMSKVLSQRRRWDTPSHAVANGVYNLRNLNWFPAVLSVLGHVAAASQVCSYLTNFWGKCQLALLCKLF